MTPNTRPVIALAELLLIVVLALYTNSAALACCNSWQEYADYCRSTGGNPVTNPPRCLPAAGNSAADDSAYLQEQAEQQAADQARQQQLKRDEDERTRKAEEARLVKEQQQHAAFIQERDSAVLKGDTGTHFFGIGGLKGSDSTDSELKGISAAKPESELRDLSGANAAWKQLNCAAAIAGDAIAALQTALDGKSDERDEFKYLSSESSKALSGEALGVACPPPRALPSRNGQPVDIDKGKIALTRILDRATTMSERLPAPLATSPQPSSARPLLGNASDDLGKLRETQLALNRTNERKYDTASQDAINHEKQAKQEAAALLLAAHKVETGDFSISLGSPSSSGAAGAKGTQQ